MKVLIVCTGNTCRSPMLESMLKAYFKTDGLALSDVEILSAGLEIEDKHISENTRLVLSAHGLEVPDHGATFCDRSQFEAADIVFTMTNAQADRLALLYGDNGKIISLATMYGEDIIDPYGRDLKAYEQVYEIFKELIPSIAERICK